MNRFHAACLFKVSTHHCVSERTPLPFSGPYRAITRAACPAYGTLLREDDSSNKTRDRTRTRVKYRTTCIDNIVSCHHVIPTALSRNTSHVSPLHTDLALHRLAEEAFPGRKLCEADEISTQVPQGLNRTDLFVRVFQNEVITAENRRDNHQKLEICQVPSDTAPTGSQRMSVYASTVLHMPQSLTWDQTRTG